MASLHGARAHGLLDRGAIAPGYVADLALLDDLESFAVSLTLKDGREPSYPEAAAAELRDTMRSVPVSFAIAGEPARVRVIDIEPGQLITGAGSEPPRIDGRARRRRSRARPGQDRRDRAPPRDRPRRSRPRARVRADRGRVRVDRRPRRAQPRRRRRLRRGHGAVRGARAGARRRARRRPRRRGARRAAAADRRAALRRAAGGGRRGARAPAGPAARAGRRDRRAVHDALVPGAVGDPVAEDHRPRAGRRRCVPARPAGAQRPDRLRPRHVRGALRRAVRALAVGGRARVAAGRLRGRRGVWTRRCAARCTTRPKTPSSR